MSSTHSKACKPTLSFYGIWTWRNDTSNLAIIASFTASMLVWGWMEMSLYMGYVMLWLMHLSARLNVFLGVRNVSAEFVPEHMAILRSFLRKRNMNPLFPVSCIFLVAFTIWLVFNSGSENLPYTIAATLSLIGLLEHVLLMLPLPVEKLWHWSQARKAKPVPPPPSDTTKLYTGYPGA